MHADLDEYLAAQSQRSFAHIDAYGVLHHMPNPSATLTLLSSRLQIGGSLRLMVYNGAARRWIHHLQRLFSILGIDRLSTPDIKAARTLLSEAAAVSPALATRLRQLGSDAFANDARFADTFLHPRETRLSVTEWLTAINNAGLRVVGLLDRYAELDDLPNPLWHAPSPAELAARAADGRFEHNLELYLTHADSPLTLGSAGMSTQRGALWWFPYLLKAPPHLWFSYEETRSLPVTSRLKLWRAHLAWVLHRDRRDATKMLARLPTAALQRLVRVGAILPGQITSPGRCAALATPISQTSPEVIAPPAPLAMADTINQCPRVHAQLSAMLMSKGRHEERYLRQALARLYRAQC